MPKVPLIVHIPHSSMYIPPDIRPTIQLNDEDLQKELLTFTDRYTDELFSSARNCGTILLYNYSRFVVDPERFRDEAQEEMSNKGFGAVYTKTSAGIKLREISEDEEEELKKRFYDPHHARLEQAVENDLRQFGKCLILDAHSFPTEPLPYENRGLRRPDICIGTCEFHTPETIVKSVENFFQAKGFSVLQNEPYTGSLVPLKYYRKDARVISIMVEINRSLYMEETTGEKGTRFPEIKGILDDLLELLGQTIS